MPIIRTIPTENFAQNSNYLIDTPMRFKAKEILLHLLAKPDDWKVIKSAVCKTLELSMYIVKKSLSWLRNHGYAVYRRSKTGYGEWFIFSEPQPTTPVKSPQFVIPALATPTALVTPINLVKHKEQQHEQPIIAPIPEKIPEIIQIPEQQTVVVFSEDKEELTYPPQLNKDQKKYTKAKIKTAPVELQQEVLFELAYRMTLQTIHNLPGYLNILVTAANNGTFSRTGGNGSVKKVNPAFAATQALFDKQATFKKPDPKTHEIGMAALKAACR
jgi:hypothetical protein